MGRTILCSCRTYKKQVLVAMPLGNAPRTDILAVTPKNKHFRVEVKTLSKSEPWLVKEPEPNDFSLFFVVVYLKPKDNPEFYIITHNEVRQEIIKQRMRNVAGKKWKDGFNWTVVKPHKDKWKKLPDYPSDS